MKKLSLILVSSTLLLLIGCGDANQTSLNGDVAPENNTSNTKSSTVVLYTSNKQEDQNYFLYASIDNVTTPLVPVDRFYSFEVLPDNKHLIYKYLEELYFIDMNNPTDIKQLTFSTANSNKITAYSLSPDLSKLVYRMYDDPNDEKLILLDIENNTSIILNNSEPRNVKIQNFEWSPNGEKVLYSTGNINLTTELYTASSDGSHNQKISGILKGQDVHYDYSWSPDSSKVLYLAALENNQSIELYTVFADGSHNTKISGSLSFSSQFTQLHNTYFWSADSNKVVFKAMPNILNRPNLYSVLSDGTHLTKLNEDDIHNTRVNTLKLSPDAKSIGYTLYDYADENVELYTYSFENNITTKVSGDILAEHHVYSTFQWSPDSRNILFITDLDTLGVADMYSVRADGSQRVNLTHNTTLQNISTPTWSPDGTKIMYRTQEYGRALYVIDTTNHSSLMLHQEPVDGGSVSFITNGNNGFNYPVKQIPQWSPDSKNVLFAGDINIDGWTELYLSSSTQTDNKNISNNSSASIHVDYYFIFQLSH